VTFRLGTGKSLTFLTVQPSQIPMNFDTSGNSLKNSPAELCPSPTIYLNCPHYFTYSQGHNNISYLCTYDLYVPVCTVMFLIHYEGKWEGDRPRKSRLFWALSNGIEPLGECHLFGKKKLMHCYPPPPPPTPPVL
jgi:hypothetical protein